MRCTSEQGVQHFRAAAMGQGWHRAGARCHLGMCPPCTAPAAHIASKVMPHARGGRAISTPCAQRVAYCAPWLTIESWGSGPSRAVGPSSPDSRHRVSANGCATYSSSMVRRDHTRCARWGVARLSAHVDTDGFDRGSSGAWKVRVRCESSSSGCIKVRVRVLM